MEYNNYLNSNECTMQYGCIIPATSAIIAYLIEIIGQLFD
jgi:hypothetical protein